MSDGVDAGGAATGLGGGNAGAILSGSGESLSDITS